MAVAPIGEPGVKLRKCIAVHREHLFVFMTNRDVPPTNNVSERSPAPERDISQSDQWVPL
jgi:hypothetical protein